MSFFPHARLLLAAALSLVAASAVAAQPSPATSPTPFQGLQVNRDKPIQISAATLEVRDKEKKATFLGNVNVVQGETTLKCKTLDVFYDQDAGAAPRPQATSQGPGSGQQIRRLEAKGSVVVVQKEQTATGDAAIFDVASNSVTLIGNVVVTQGQNVIRGDRINVDLTTGVTRVESGVPGESRVQGLFLPNAPKPELAKPAPASKAAPKAGQKQPLKLN
jgi:lipopolysaccharide export system protein LptA